MGINNLKSRLHLEYGENHHFKISTNEDTFTAELEIG